MPFVLGRSTLDRSSISGCAIVDARTTHIPDLGALGAHDFATSQTLAVGSGARAALAAPMLREGVAIGCILLRRTVAGPFTSKQNELLEAFAARRSQTSAESSSARPADAPAPAMTRSEGGLRNEREEMSAVMMVREDRLDIDPKVFTPGHLVVIRAAAQEPTVQRIFVNAAIKKALCREAKGDRSWLHKVRPMYGHDYHFHIRIKCPPGSGGECETQPDPDVSEGCAASDFAFWFKDSTLHPKPPKEPVKPKPPMTMAQLPPACRAVLNLPDAKP